MTSPQINRGMTMSDLMNKTDPRKRPCSSCLGRGRIEKVVEEPCSACAGTGRNLKADLFLEFCNRCNGKGRITWITSKTCTSCYGRGTARY